MHVTITRHRHKDETGDTSTGARHRQVHGPSSTHAITTGSKLKHISCSSDSHSHKHNSLELQESSLTVTGWALPLSTSRPSLAASLAVSPTSPRVGPSALRPPHGSPPPQLLPEHSTPHALASLRPCRSCALRPGSTRPRRVPLARPACSMQGCTWRAVPLLSEEV